jgi:hypothetical protein
LAPVLAFADFLAAFLAISMDSCHFSSGCPILGNRSCAPPASDERDDRSKASTINSSYTLQNHDLRHAYDRAYIEICRPRQPQRLAFEEFARQAAIVT